MVRTLSTVQQYGSLKQKKAQWGTDQAKPGRGSGNKKGPIEQN